VTEVVQLAKPQRTTAKARGLGRTYQRGGTWWVQYYDRGKLCRESSGSERESDANKLLKRRFAEIGQGRLVGPVVERTTLEDLAEMLFNDYRVNGRKSLDRAERSVEHLKTCFARSRAIDITPDRVSAYIDSRLRVAKPATIRLELAALGRMFTLGVRAGKVSHRPYIPSIEVRNTRSGFFEEAELRRVLDQLPADLRFLVEFLHSTGWRVGEAKQLTWRQVDFTAGVVRLEPGTTKNDEGRTFPFAAWPRLTELLRLQRERTSALEREQGRLIPWVFHRNGKPVRSLHSAWREACKRARVPGRLIHDLRRTAVRNFERAGVSRSAAMKLSGHKTESVYRRYAIVSEADLAEAVCKVAALSAGGVTAVRRLVPITESHEPRTSTDRRLPRLRERRTCRAQSWTWCRWRCASSQRARPTCDGSHRQGTTPRSSR
jgi:integrase